MPPKKNTKMPSKKIVKKPSKKNPKKPAKKVSKASAGRRQKASTSGPPRRSARLAAPGTVAAGLPSLPASTAKRAKNLPWKVVRGPEPEPLGDEKYWVDTYNRADSQICKSTNRNIIDRAAARLDGRTRALAIKLLQADGNLVENYVDPWVKYDKERDGDGSAN